MKEQIEILIGEYDEIASESTLKKMEYESIEDAISTIEFLKMQYQALSNGKSLLVRTNQNSKLHLLHSESITPIIEIRKELEKKYNLENSNEKEQFKERMPLSYNSNFSFEKDERIRYAKTTTGENLPFKLFSSHINETRSSLLQEQGSRFGPGDFAGIERCFSENHNLQFMGSEKIKNYNDIAWLFKSLEDEAIEHAFVVYNFEEKGYFVQHVSTGTFNATLVDPTMFIGNIIEAQPKSITFVHNHPSGHLKASSADFTVYNKIKDALSHTSILLTDGIIINLRSGKYLAFDSNYSEMELQRIETSNLLQHVRNYSFNKQIFLENYQPVQINSSEDAAQYISTQKFGVSDKTELLVLNTKNDIVGKFLLPSNNELNFILEKVLKFGGNACILFGNSINEEQVIEFQRHLKHSNVSLLDALQFESSNGRKIYKSLANDGILQEQAVLYSRDSNFNFSDYGKEYKITLAHVDYLIENLPKEDMIKMLDEFKVDPEIIKIFKQVFENENIEDSLSFPLSESKLEDQFKERKYHLVNTINMNDQNKEIFLTVGNEYVDNAKQKFNSKEMRK